MEAIVEMMRWLGSITDSMDMNLSKLQETVKDGRAERAAAHGVAKSRTRLSDGTTAASLEGPPVCTVSIICKDPVICEDPSSLA